MLCPELAGVLTSLGLGASVQLEERAEAPGGGSRSPGRVSGFQRPRLNRRPSAQVSTEGPTHLGIFLGMCGTGRGRGTEDTGTQAPEGQGSPCQVLLRVPLAQAQSRPVATPAVLQTTRGPPLCACAPRCRAASLICLFCFLSSQNILFRRCHFD